MELDQLQERWRQLDQKLDRTMATNSAVLRQIGLQGTRRRISRLAVWPVIDLVFGVGVLLVAGTFLGDHWLEPTLVLSALGLITSIALRFVVPFLRGRSHERITISLPFATEGDADTTVEITPSDLGKQYQLSFTLAGSAFAFLVKECGGSRVRSVLARCGGRTLQSTG